MLIVEETCGDTESRSKKPSVVARLMGLDSIPVQKSVASNGKVRDDDYLMNGLKAAFQQWQPQQASAYVEGDSRDVYEVEQQSKNAWVEERFEQDFYRRRLALARRKFMEVKHSEEFQDPVEVLNSNSVFSKHLFEPQSVSGTTRITVLKPSNTTGRKGNRFIKTQLLSDSDENVGKVNRFCWSTDLSGPTSIVVLKPSGDLARDQLITSRDEVEVVNEESLGILSSESSNGYIADDSSFDKSDSVYFDDEIGSASDLESATLATEYSWDYMNKTASPEPSVIREAKKKLSERLAFVSSNVNFLEPRYLRASRSTLGELLAVSEGSNKEHTHSTKSIAQTWVPKSKPRKLSLKDKVSSFFFSRSKRPSEDAPPGALSDVLSSFNATFLGDSNRSLDGFMDLPMFPEGDPIEKSGNLTESQDKCCPSSVAAKSPDHFIVFEKADEEHEQFVFLQKLISSSGWHSLHSPLNPYLLYEDEKHREVHSNRRLLFDSINAVLFDITQSALLEVYPWTRALGPELRKDGDSDGNATVAEQVWAILRKGSASERVIPKESACGSIVVERVVKREVTGRQWEETKWLDLCDFGKEVGGKVLEELVEDLLLELSCH